jgi:hypothetical protein
MDFDIVGAATSIIIGVAIGVAIAAGALTVAIAVMGFRHRKAVLDYVATMPTTNVRIVVTIGLIILTGIRYLVAGPPPGEVFEEWLMFLGVLAGIDVGHFGIKRVTTKPELMQQALTRESVDPAPAAPGVGAGLKDDLRD